MQTAGPYGRRYFLTCAKQTTNLASINSTQLRHFPVLIPPLSEQNKITEVLTTWDRAIARTEKLLSAKELLMVGLMQTLLTGKRRFEGFAGDKWQTYRLSDLLERVFRPVTLTPDVPLALVSIRRRARGLFLGERSLRESSRPQTLIASKPVTSWFPSDRLVTAPSPWCVNHLPVCTRRTST